MGLKLARNTKGGEIAYGLIAGLVALAYVTIVVSKNLGRFVGSKVRSDKDGGKRRENRERIPMVDRIPARIRTRERI